MYHKAANATRAAISQRITRFITVLLTRLWSGAQRCPFIRFSSRRIALSWNATLTTATTSAKGSNAIKIIFVILL
jgi:hypothetical protein